MNPTKTREGDQPLPTTGRECVQDLIIAEMQESKRVGMSRYGSTLRTFNGRRSIQDVAEEVRDLHVYLTQVRAESEADRETLVSVVAQALLDQIPSDEKSPAEIAVDAVMGWVTGQISLLDGSRLSLATDYGHQARQAAVAHLRACQDALYAQEDAEPDETIESPAVGLYCACDDCEVREVLAAAYPILEAGILRDN